MSSAFVPSNDGGASYHINSAEMDALAPKKLIPLPPKEWNEFREFLTDLFMKQNCTTKQLNQIMRGLGYQTTPKTILYHLNKWGIRRYQTSTEKEELCRHLLDGRVTGRYVPPLDNRVLKKLQRYCKKNPRQSDSDKILLNLLRDLEITPAISSDHRDDPLADVSTENQHTSTNIDQWHMINTSSYDHMSSQAPNSQSCLQLDHGTSLDSDIMSELAGQIATDVIPEKPADTDFETHLTYIPNTIIREPGNVNSKSRAEEWLCDLSQRYYHVELQKHFICLQGLNSSGANVASGPGNYVDTLSQNRLFWTKIKSGIYYLKMSSDRLARQELSEAFGMIPLLCQRQPFPLLTDIFATISPIATRVRPSLRFEILRTFRHNAAIKLGPDHVFSEICRILCMEEGSDEFCIAMLKTMLDATKKVLPPEHPEVFEFQRTLIRLYRRQRDFSTAEELAWSLVQSSETVHDKNHVNSRLALSEYVYILNDQNRYEEALNIAEDVLHRGRLDLGHKFPDERSMYAMEDVAEICEKLGRINDSIDWLRNASRSALSLRGNHTSTEHIWDKLDALQDKRYRQAVQEDML